MTVGDQIAIMAVEKCPELMRRYGKQDFQKFDHLGIQKASIGAATIGKVNVDCSFLFSKSQWGVLDGAEDPAGIVYLDLSFNQPKEQRLKSARVVVTLDDDDRDLAPFGGQSRMVPVHFCHYGPQRLDGQARHALKTQQRRMVPSLNVMGMAGFGGVGQSSEKLAIQECRWSFSSQLLTDPKSENCQWAYKVLVWDLNENELEVQALQSNIVHTAFSFKHDGQPFFMKVDISGRLESKSSDLARKFKFSSKAKNAPSATTLVNFGGRGKFHKPLDKLSEGLPLAMEEENMRSVPVQLPGTQTPFYSGATSVGNDGARPSTAPIEPTTSRDFLTRILNRRAHQEALQESDVGHVEPDNLFTDENPSHAPANRPDRTQPTTENLAYARQLLSRQLEPVLRQAPERRARRVPASFRQTEEEQSHGVGTLNTEDSAMSSSAATLLGSEFDLMEGSVVKGLEEQSAANAEALALALKMPALLTFLQFLISVWELCGMRPSRRAVKY